MFFIFFKIKINKYKKRENKIYTNKYFDKKPSAEQIPNNNQNDLLFVSRLFQKK